MILAVWKAMIGLQLKVLDGSVPYVSVTLNWMSIVRKKTPDSKETLKV